MACKHFREDVIPSKVTTDKTTPQCFGERISYICYLGKYPIEHPEKCRALGYDDPCWKEAEGKEK